MDYSYWRQTRNSRCFGQLESFDENLSNQYGAPVVAYFMPVAISSQFRPSAKQKSRAQKLRDQQRRQRFLERKSICAAMPFYDIANEELSKLMPKSLCHMTCDPTQLLLIESVLNAATKEMNRIQEENIQLKDSVSSLPCLISAEQRRLRKEEQQALLSAEETERLRKALSDEKQQIRTLTKDLGEERDRREMFQEACDERLEMINSLRQTLSVKDREYLAFRQVSDSNRDAHEETVSKLNIQIKELQTKLATKKLPESKCKNCGLNDCGHPNNCAAYFNICKNCQTQGHFTKYCGFICDTCGDVEYHPPNSCIRPNGYSMVRGNLADTRSGHRNSRPNDRRRQGRLR